MASETIAIPEAELEVFCAVVRAGLRTVKTSRRFRSNLLREVKELEAYAKRLRDED